MLLVDPLLSQNNLQSLPEPKADIHSVNDSAFVCADGSLTTFPVVSLFHGSSVNHRVGEDQCKGLF